MKNRFYDNFYKARGIAKTHGNSHKIYQILDWKSPLNAKQHNIRRSLLISPTTRRLKQESISAGLNSNTALRVVRSLDKDSKLFCGGTSTDLIQKCNYVQTIIHRRWNRGEEDNAGLLSELSKLDPRERHFRIAIDGDLNIFLRHLGPAFTTTTSKAVLYVHGATFPSALSIAHRFDGHSCRDALNAAGFDVWGLDVLGYGGSDRYPEMAQSPESMPALGRAESGSRQIERAAEFI